MVLAMESAKQRTLSRIGLDMSGIYEVVGVAVDERDVAFIVGSLHPDIVLIDFPDGRGLPVVSTVKESWPHAVPVMYHALVARHHAETGGSGEPRPVEIARLVHSTVGDRVAVGV